jgi:hypothetical protein
VLDAVKRIVFGVRLAVNQFMKSHPIIASAADILKMTIKYAGDAIDILPYSPLSVPGLFTRKASKKPFTHLNTKITWL